MVMQFLLLSFPLPEHLTNRPLKERPSAHDAVRIFSSIFFLAASVYSLYTRYVCMFEIPEGFETHGHNVFYQSRKQVVSSKCTAH